MGVSWSKVVVITLAGVRACGRASMHVEKLKLFDSALMKYMPAEHKQKIIRDHGDMTGHKYRQQRRGYLGSLE